MKKIIAFMMAGLMTATALAGCGGSGEKKESATEAATKAATADTAATADSAGEDWTYLESKGNLVIGITYFEPMNYMDENNELTGFETDFAKAVCEELKLEPKFQEIDWDSKEIELKTKSIDCIWNGLTITPERQENMDISVPYMENKQVMVCNKDKVAQFAESVEGASVVAESGSAGEDVAKEDEFYNVIDGLEKQCIIVTKDFMTKGVVRTKDIEKLSCPVYRIKKAEGFDKNNMSTIRTTVKKLKD